MSTAEQSLAVITLTSTVPIVGFAVYAIRNRAKPGVRGLVLCLVGMVGWSVQIALLTWPSQIMSVSLNTALRYLFQSFVVLGWPLLVWEYSNRTQLSFRRYSVGALVVIPVVTVILAATNPWHHLVFTAETPADPAGISEFIYGPWSLIYIAFEITVAVFPVGTLLSDLRVAHGVHRRQLLLLLAGWCVAFAGALHVFVFRDLSWVPLYVDLTSLSFVATAGLWAMALFRYNLFGMLPVSRRMAIETMPDPVVSVDSDGIVVDANPAAQQLFTLNDKIGGTTLETFCEGHPAVLERYALGESLTAQVSLDTDLGTRHFSMYVRPIRQGGVVIGSLIVLREVTQQRAHQQELDVLKQVLSRVFRHNVRNRLNVIHGHTSVLAEELDEQSEEYVETILDNIDQLLGHSDKAVDMQKIIDTEADTRVDLGAVARKHAGLLKDKQFAVEIDVECPDGVIARCHPDIGKAIDELLANAVDHYEGPRSEFRLRLTVARRDRMAVLVIEDNGPGIPDHEIEALNAGEETDLKHGSGVGLWLVRLLVEKSGGTLSIDDETALDGTRVELEVPIWESTDSDVPAASPQNPSDP